jgi:hexosaminidase
MHLDVCRHFFPVSFVKKYIDYLAAYKFNTFHWHLTDDQGWRIEIKKYPELTKIGAQRNGTIIGRYPGKGSDNKPYGGFYTQAEIKEVVQYAKDRYIDVIPEIEMPGHSSAAIAAYPWLSCFPEKPTEIPAKMISQKSIDEQKAGRIKLVQETWGVFDDVFCAGKDSTFKFLENVLDEVIKLFPSKYIHLGGDESPKTHWEICPSCQKRIKDNNLKDEHELQSWFVQHMEKYVNSKGKTMIGWDEILEGGLAPNAVVMSWRGEAGGIEAAKQKHQVIMTPGNPVYFDHTQSKNEDSITIGGYNPIENVYAYEPIPKELNAGEGKYILGAQANMWTEYLEYPSKVEYMLFPRITALSEVLWSPKEKRDWKDFERRLPVIFDRLDKQKINYSKAYYDLKATVEPTFDNNGILWKLESKSQKNINYTFFALHGTLSPNPFETLNYTNPIKITEAGIATGILSDNKKELSVLKQNFSFNKATGKKITLVTQPSKSYPGDGAFTLVNAVQNEKGMSKSSEFLGFNGTDLNATIDLGTLTDISKITLHVLEQNGSWIYLPSQVEVTYIPDVDYTEEQLKTFPKEIKKIDPVIDKGTKTVTIESKQNCRYIKIVAKNYGVIPSGQPGAGNPAWLFVDEIEVQ